MRINCRQLPCVLSFLIQSHCCFKRIKITNGQCRLYKKRIGGAAVRHISYAYHQHHNYIPANTTCKKQGSWVITKHGLIYTDLNGNMKQNFSVIKNDLLQTGVVQNASLSNNQVLQLGSNTGDFEWPGKDPKKQVLITVEAVSPEYISTMDMHLKGREGFLC